MLKIGGTLPPNALRGYRPVWY